MPHTKRSPEFCAELDTLIHKLNLRMLDGEGIRRITEILKDNTTDSACIVKAAADEPIFVLRGKDPAAFHAVKSWKYHGAPWHEPAKIRDAEQCAVEMAEFCRKG